MCGAHTVCEQLALGPADWSQAMLQPEIDPQSVDRKSIPLTAVLPNHALHINSLIFSPYELQLLGYLHYRADERLGNPPSG